jgi:hypothetical protein
LAITNANGTRRTNPTSKNNGKPIRKAAKKKRPRDVFPSAD